MNRTLDVFVADSSGNITIMVLTPTDRKDYKDVARQLLEKKELGGEQVAFILPEASEMEMCGLEFCGNASRAFALYVSQNCEDAFSVEDSTDLQKTATVKVSGCDHLLTARIDADGMVDMDMPVPSQCRSFSAKELSLNKGGLLVNMDGIAHLILEDIAPSGETFDILKHFIYESVDPSMPAFGVMFCDTVNKLMTPVVYVKDVDTTYFEGSCASGTVAAAYALADVRADGIHEFTMQQPEGVLHASVTKKEDRIEKISLKGPVTLSDVMQTSVSAGVS